MSVTMAHWRPVTGGRWLTSFDLSDPSEPADSLRRRHLYTRQRLAGWVRVSPALVPLAVFKTVCGAVLSRPRWVRFPSIPPGLFQKTFQG